MNELRDVSALAFQNQMILHAQKFSPRLCDTIGENRFGIAIVRAMERARGYGFTARGPIRLYIELTLLFGSRFDTDPQYPWSGEILHREEDQMSRALGLYEKTVDYQTTVSGTDGVNTMRALRDLARQAEHMQFPGNGFADDILQKMRRIFPEKAEYVADEGLRTLIREAIEEAQHYHFPEVRGCALLAILKFAFGHGCTNDPLYPWISQTLEDQKIVEPAARANRLERKAKTWLDHVVAREGARE